MTEPHILKFPAAAAAPLCATIEPASELDLQAILHAWNQATDRLQATHEALRAEVRRLSDELEAKNRELARSRRWVLVVPRPSLPTALAATAWRRRLACPEGADPLRADGPIGNFVTAFRNQGPEKGFV